MQTTYAILRTGSNAANQSMTHEAWVGIFRGEGRTADERRNDACRKAEEGGVSVYANQWLDALPWSRLSADDQQIAQEADWQREEEERVNQEELAEINVWLAGGGE